MSDNVIEQKISPTIIPDNLTEGINDWASILKMIGHPQRLSILYTLCQKPSSVKDLQDQLKMPQSVLSQHLGLLRRANIVKRKKEGTLAIYSIGQKRLHMLMDTICAVPTPDNDH